MTERSSIGELEAAMPFREALDADPDRGIVLFDAWLRQVYVNPSARPHLLDPNGPAAVVLREAVAAAKTRAERGDGQNLPEVPIIAADGRPFRLEVVVLRRESHRWFLARISPPGISTDPTVRRLQTRFHLTLRESEIALEVSRGHSNSETAGKLGVTEKTVKNALVAVYGKCGVRNRVELALRVHDAPIGNH